MPRGRVAAIIVKDNAVALIERRRGDDIYYLFPGGAVEGNESPTEALIREIYEELGLHIEMDQLVAEVSYQGASSTTSLPGVVGGVFGAGYGREIVGPTAPEDGTCTPVWIPIAQMHHKPVYPECVVETILNAMESGWPATPLKFEDPGRA